MSARTGVMIPTIEASPEEIYDIELERSLLEANAKLAAENRALLDQQGITAIDFMGAIGSGKTTLANLIAKELGGTLHGSSGPTLEKPKDLVGILTALGASDVLFIDEIHRLGAVVEAFDVRKAVADSVLDAL